MIAVQPVEHGKQLLPDRRAAGPDCNAPLHRYGHGRAQTVRGPGESTLSVTPRRVRCPGCARTHLPAPAALPARRADTSEVIGMALAARTRGAGARRIAATLGRAVSTVRAWLRPDAGHSERLYRPGQGGHRTGLTATCWCAPWPSPPLLAEALDPLANAALALPAWLRLDDPPWNPDRVPGRRPPAAGAAHVTPRPALPTIAGHRHERRARTSRSRHR